MAEPSNDVRTLARPVDERKEGVAFHEQTRRTRTAEPLASLCDCGIGPVPLSLIHISFVALDFEDEEGNDA